MISPQRAATNYCIVWKTTINNKTSSCAIVVRPQNVLRTLPQIVAQCDTHKPLCCAGWAVLGRLAHKACAQGLEHKPVHNHRTLCAQLRTTPCAQGLRTRPRTTPGSLCAQGNSHKADTCAHKVFFVPYIIVYFLRI